MVKEENTNKAGGGTYGKLRERVRQKSVWRGNEKNDYQTGETDETNVCMITYI